MSTLCVMVMAKVSPTPLSMLEGTGCLSRVHSGREGSARYTGLMSCWNSFA